MSRIDEAWGTIEDNRSTKDVSAGQNGRSSVTASFRCEAVDGIDQRGGNA
ncbi:MAG: hypothetical protein U0996_05010 [Planctomycetaceae bacterium]